MVDLFDGLSRETPWEWAKKRRRIFTSPGRDMFIAFLGSLTTLVILVAAGAENWLLSVGVSVGVGVVTRVLPPIGETYYYYRQRDRILLEEELERHRQAAVAKETETASNADGISGKFNDVVLGQGTVTTPLNETFEGAFIMLRVTLTNTGKPAAVESYRFSATVGTVQIWGESQSIPEHAEFPPAMSGGVPIHIYAVDDLNAKAATPIETGGLVRGWKIYFLRGVNVHALVGPQVKFCLEMQDTLKRMIKIEQTGGKTAVAGTKPLLNYPGMQPSTVNPYPAPPQTTAPPGRLTVKVKTFDRHDNKGRQYPLKLRLTLRNDYGRAIVLKALRWELPSDEVDVAHTDRIIRFKPPASKVDILECRIGPGSDAHVWMGLNPSFTDEEIRHRLKALRLGAMVFAVTTPEATIEDRVHL